MPNLEEAIKQNQFKSEFQKAGINLLFTANRFMLHNNDTLKPFDLTVAQFNILRILKGQHPKACSVKGLTERMIDRSSNASRLVDRLLKKGLLERKECPEDRRQVNVIINKSGLKLINKASKVLDKEISEVFSKFSIAEAKKLNKLLNKITNIF